jgi:hypothetical protein
MKELRNVRPFSRKGKKDEELGDLSAFALAPAAVPADFVARVMRGLPVEGVREGRQADFWKWAAALLIFSVAAGYGFGLGERGLQTDLQASASVSSVSVPSEGDILSD